MAGDYTRCLRPVTTHGVNGFDYTRRLWPVTMAGDYTRCLWPVTTHGVYGR